MVAVTVAGFETYRAFAPEGWTPPDNERRRLVTTGNVTVNNANNEGPELLVVPPEPAEPAAPALTLFG